MRDAALRFLPAAGLFAVGALVLALVLGGGAPRPAPVGIPDPGPLVGWGVPLVTLLVDSAAILTIGFLLVAVALLPGDGPRLRGLAARAVPAAGLSALGWLIATAVQYLLTVSDLFAVTVTESFDTALLWGLTRDSTIGRGLLVQAGVAAGIAIASRWVVSVRLTAALLGLAVVGLVPGALAGHAASAGSHDLAVVTLLVHVAAAALWVGGLFALLWVARRGSKRLPEAVIRYSRVTGWLVGALTVSGLINGWLRLDGLGGLTSGYAGVMAAKLVALVALVALGAVQRRAVVARWRFAGTTVVRGAAFMRLAAAEILLMALAIGLAVALSRTPSPAPEEVLATPAENLLGRPMPPAPDLERLLWTWYPSGVGLLILTILVAGYAGGVLALRRRGDRWPVGRIVAWGTGVIVLAWAWLGGLGVYSHVLFSAHMVSHMILSMVAPIFLVLGAPFTLALRTLPGPRRPGEVSPRQLLNELLHSRPARLLTHPVVAAVIFVGSLYAVYFTGLFEALMMLPHWGHIAMELHFLAAGFLFYYVVIGVDPAPRRLPSLVRFGVLVFTIPFHAFFAIALMQSSEPVAAGYYAELGRPYRTDLLADQYLAGGITWALGEVPLVVVMAVLFVQWVISDRREARRLDRAADRDDDAELAAYNAYLARLGEHRGERP